MGHMRSQLNIASGMFIWSRFRSDCKTVRDAIDTFEAALKLKESMVGKQVGSGPDTARADDEVVREMAAGDDGGTQSDQHVQAPAALGGVPARP